MIRRFHAKNFGCLKDVSTPDLTPLHAFIGPNDSGKSTVLTAVRLLATFALSKPQETAQEEAARDGLIPWLSPALNQTIVAAETQHGYYGFGASLPLTNDLQEFAGTGPYPEGIPPSYKFWQPGVLREISRDSGPLVEVFREIGTVRVLRLDPDALRQESELIPADGPVGFLDDRGRGLPGVYDAIQNRGDDSFAEIRERVRNQFSTVRNLQLRTNSKTTKVLQVQLHDGTFVRAEQMSEGMLYFLAFLAVQYLEPVSILLVEEPENGLHPARIADVVRMLRVISESRRSQVLVSTHSPLVVNELHPNEVTVVTRDPKKGTQLRLLGDTPDFKARSKVYALGELWLSYADGIGEAPLLTGGQDHE
ncbi:MAG: ATP-binding protein [Thermoanaerobaculia bacterium]|nr:ATP-binding protein [Thermoanaerobaculia bacterium]